MVRVLALLGVVGAGLLVLAGPVVAAPVASFTYSPTEPFTGEVVTFTSTA
ncbi:MAG: hypothetical protein QOI45_367, partial [Thermoleophilaceae bacterium]|nr:hypothetical protein [Thermoleophilaceae bacterium]